VAGFIEFQVQHVYAIGSRQRECHGHGEYSDELAIRQCVTSNWPACDFAPLFASEEAARKWIRHNPQFGPGLEPVRLSYIATVDKEKQ
jgi:hypothetical protein